MWDNLIELVHLNSSKSSRITALIEFFNQEDAEQSVDLYQRLQKGKLGRDEFDHLLKDGASSQALGKLDEQFIRTYFFSNLERSGFNDYHSAEVECWKNWVAVRLLFGRSAMIFPQKTCLKILKQADRFGFHRLSIDIAKQLRLYYGAQLGDVKRFKKYDDLIVQEKQKLYWVKKASQALKQARLSLLRSEAVVDIDTQLAEVIKQLEKAPSTQHSFQLGYHIFLLRIQRSLLTRQWAECADLCKEAAAYCSKKLNRSKGSIDHFFLLLHVFSLMKEKKFSKAGELLKKIERFEKKGAPLWFDNQRYAFILALHQKDYEQAAAVLDQVRGHSKFRILHPIKAACWLLFERCLLFLQEIKAMPLSDNLSLTESHLGLSRTEVLNAGPLPLSAHEHLLSLMSALAKGRLEKAGKLASDSAKEISGLKNRGYLRLAAMIEFLTNSTLKASKGSIEQGSIPESLEDYPLIASINHCFFEELLPFEFLFGQLKKQGPQSQAAQ